MRVGVPELILLWMILIGPILAVVLGWGVVSGRRARQFGYASRGDYLRAVPKSDGERRDAADLALKGLVICLLGLFFAPIALAGVVPLFYGGRKVIYASLGLGLVDDRIEPRA